MSRNINIGGHKETFPDYYVKIFSINKSITLGGNNTYNIDYTTEITNAGYSVNDVVAQWGGGWTVGSTWETWLSFLPPPSSGVLQVRTHGTTSQGYLIQGVFVIKVKAADSY